MAHAEIDFDCIFKFVCTSNYGNAETESGLVNEPGLGVTGSAQYFSGQIMSPGCIKYCIWVKLKFLKYIHERDAFHTALCCASFWITDA